MMFIRNVIAACVAAQVTLAVCDNNPHAWPRSRRCDQYDPSCPDASWAGDCSLCEGIGGIAANDENTATSFTPTKCTPVATAAEMKAMGFIPKPPKFADTFVNTGFYEVQIFVKHDPFCFAQIPASVSTGKHCYKRQEGTFNYDATQGALRIDYLKSTTVFKGVNMTEHFYHLSDGTVHPNIPKYGALNTPVCPCIKLGVGPVAPNWAFDAEYIGRERLDIEFLGSKQVLVDHYLKGPHHVWADVASGKIIRMWQPFNGLEIFDPAKWTEGPRATAAVGADAFKLPTVCSLEAKLGCINGEAKPQKAGETSDELSEDIMMHFW